MDERLEFYFKQLKKAIEVNDKIEIQAILKENRPEDIAEYVRLLKNKDKLLVFTNIKDTEKAGVVLNEIDDSSKDFLLSKLENNKISLLLNELALDDIADIIGDLEQETIDEILAQFKNKQKSYEIRKVLKYDEESAGGLMVPKVVTLTEDLNVQQALEKIRQTENKEVLYHIYVEDEEGKLVGVLPLRKLVFSQGISKLKDLMHSEVIKVRVDMDQEEVARIFNKYNLLAIPVVDYNNVFVGSITVDDILEVMREEHSEDMLKLAGTDDDELYMQSSLNSFKLRFPWLFASWIGGLLAAVVIGGFEESLKRVAIIAGFIPIIMGMGGNIGTQSCTIVVRSLATGAIHEKQMWRVLLREIKTAILLGTFYGVLLGIFTYFYSVFIGTTASKLHLSFTVGFSICISMLVAATIGTFVPMMLKRLKIDPAVATGPFVTTSIDIFGILNYFGLCSLLLDF